MFNQQMSYIILTEEKVTDAINTAGRKFIGNLRQIKGFRVSTRANGQCVSFALNVPKDIVDHLNIGPEKAVTEYVDQEKKHLVFYFNFNSNYFIFEKRTNFFSDWSKSFMRWEKSQDERTRRVIRSHPASEVACIKTGTSLIHSIIEFDISEMAPFGINNLNIRR